MDDPFREKIEYLEKITAEAKDQVDYLRLRAAQVDTELRVAQALLTSIIDMRFVMWARQDAAPAK